MAGRAWVEAPFPYWGHLRNVAAITGTRLEESKGFFRRTFTFEGENANVLEANSYIQKLKAASDNSP